MDSTILPEDSQGRRRSAAGPHRHEAGGRTIVLDIGETTGALVLYTAADREGEEIEVCSLDGGRSRTHSQVHRRHLAKACIHAAVYPNLPAGEYAFSEVAPADRAHFSIRGGQVTEIDWR